MKPGSLIVVYTDYVARNEISHIATELALRGPLTVLDGGNCFQAYRIAQLLRQRTTNVSNAANRLFIRRAFTCYQMLALLENTPSHRQPYLVLDLLANFYDDHVQNREAARLLEACLGQIERLRQFAPVAVTLGPSKLVERAFLIERVCALADTLFSSNKLAASVSQPALF